MLNELSHDMISFYIFYYNCYLLHKCFFNKFKFIFLNFFNRTVHFLRERKYLGKVFILSMTRFSGLPISSLTRWNTAQTLFHIGIRKFFHHSCRGEVLPRYKIYKIILKSIKFYVTKTTTTNLINILNSILTFLCFSRHVLHFSLNSYQFFFFIIYLSWLLKLHQSFTNLVWRFQIFLYNPSLTKKIKCYEYKKLGQNFRVQYKSVG